MENIIIIETIYMLVLALVSFLIYFYSRKPYKFSGYKGLRYYSSAFLFLGIGFIFRYIVIMSRLFKGNLGTIDSFNIVTLIMEFFLVLPGLFFLYSMIWRKFEKDFYSLKRPIAQYFIYIIALAISVIDMFMQSFYVMYASQIIVFGLACVISLKKYIKKKNNFIQLYFIGMVLFLIVWVINLIAQYTIDSFPIMRFYAYLFTVFACFMLLYITFKLTRGKI